jgi:hypothetical protein
MHSPELHLLCKATAIRETPIPTTTHIYVFRGNVEIVSGFSATSCVFLSQINKFAMVLSLPCEETGR